jgi:kumamolisin
MSPAHIAIRTSLAATVLIGLSVVAMSWAAPGSGRSEVPSAALRPVLGQAVELRESSVRGMLPEEIRRAYGIDELHARGLRGQGQVIAIMSYDTFLDSDLAAWDRETGTVGGPVERLLVSGPVPLGGGSGEVNLDIQMIRAIAPDATIVNVEAPLGTTYAPVVEAILRDGRADIASLSWGHCEALGDAFPEYRAWFEEVVRSEDAVFRQAFDAGLTIFAIPGDEGVYGCVRSVPEAFHHLLAVWYPGSHPLVVSVGGTYQWRREEGTYHREATWAGPMSGEATGGGASRFFPMPEWQRALGLEARSEMRLSPDVAGPADPDSGLMVLSTPVALRDGAWQPVSACGDGSPPPCFSFGGGTSQSAPFWAGLAALIRQGAEEQGLLPVVDGRPRMPHLLPLLYRVASERPEAFNDVTRGTNLLEDATAGWDPATGLGTPNAPVLAQAIWDLLREAPSSEVTP